MLNPAKPVTRFTVVGRTATGAPVAFEPGELTVASMLPMAAPPLPHTIAIELSTTDGRTSFDPVFKRNTPLPAEARRTYRADRTLRPSDLDGALPVKFWEVEVSDDPQEKWWAGCVRVRSSALKRPIVEGSDLELVVRIDASRKLTVDLFVPLLNQSFADDVYVPDPPLAGAHLKTDLDHCFDRLERIRGALYGSNDDGYDEDAVPVYERLQQRAEELSERSSLDQVRGVADPDAALATTDAVCKLRVQITHLEEQLKLGTGGASAELRRLRNNRAYYNGLLADGGTEAQRQQFDRLWEQLEQYEAADDARGIKWVGEQMNSVHHFLVTDRASWWHDWLDALARPDRRFVNRDEADKAIAEARAARTGGDLAALRAAVRKLWKMDPADHLRDADDRAAASGVRSP